MDGITDSMLRAWPAGQPWVSSEAIAEPSGSLLIRSISGRSSRSMSAAVASFAACLSASPSKLMAPIDSPWNHSCSRSAGRCPRPSTSPRPSTLTGSK